MKEFALPTTSPAFRAKSRSTNLLSISGGGFRGLFAARALELIVSEEQATCNEIFECLAGTSIGGIIAIGLACGTPASKIRRAIEKFGPLVFRKKNCWAGWIGAKYHSGTLLRAIKAILGSKQDLKLSEVDKPLLVVSIDQSAGSVRLLRSRGL